MTAPPPAAGPAHTGAGISPESLLEALRTNAGSLVDGAAPGSADGAPDVSTLTPSRAHAVLAAWTGARLHAGEPGLLVAADPDLGLLVGDWCFAHALQALAHDGDLEAIGRLAAAIGDCAVLLTAEPAPAGRLAEIWQVTGDALAPSA
ncbi:MAG: hypothetical protein AAGC46_06520 [Solirubrobacteraceae bacterium]|nr:hypothetical protein [Patulibacter sp.]